MRCPQTGLALAGLLLLSMTGCHCMRGSDGYGTVVDRVADTKWALDPLYVPGLDVSRIGMPDWRRFGWNNRLCPCGNGRCCHERCCKQAYYPAEYRMKYWAMQAEEQQKSDQPSYAPETAPAPEMVPPVPSE